MVVTHEQIKPGEIHDPIVNDFAFTVATKNGSGSQTSNLVLIRSLFKMGIPVNGKNLFPSNIKGLPTWYTIRVSKDGYTARRATTEIAIAMNEATAQQDIENLPSGGVCILPQEWKWTHNRDDIAYYEIPVKETIKQFDIPTERREQVGNMVYVGAVAQLFDIPLDIVHQGLFDQFGGKEKPTKMNYNIIEAAYKWTAENIQKQDPYHFAPLDMTNGKILITGNEAGALGSIFGGVTVAAWYPITPSTSLIDSMLDYRNLRKDPETGEHTVAVIQAEDEIAAIGMVVGAGWAGARAMTSTSGPGISLMSEFAGLAYFAEIPAVIWDITRVGPSTGLPTRTSQGDILFAHFLGHGDTKQVCLLPGSVAECFEFGWRAFDIAEKLQTPVFVISDLDLGMNLWMSDPFEYPDEPLDRGKTLTTENFQQFYDEHGEWFRFRDYDNDGIPYRTLPGTDHPFAAYFTRGTGHDEFAVYSERSEDWVKNMKRLRKKLETGKSFLPKPVVDTAASNTVGIISFGTNDPAVQEARDWLASKGMGTNYLRLRALPVTGEVLDFVRNHERVYVIENNFDGQLHQILRMEIPEDTRHLKSLALGDGLPMTPNWIYDNILEQERQ
ncbi:MAG: 2-oxoacid:acceptor oxidoreductase subunit alpha [Chloroflexi bacterium]|nr:MAG: 2-oxoacid:acceptor oxidoreductase subunit alpha [Phototrophicales bacterium]RMF79198.1 MAG: 2-oxoacid:acceptor oxidoreductase subunit alpha [Chloroflexota bacterium]